MVEREVDLRSQRFVSCWNVALAPGPGGVVGSGGRQFLTGENVELSGFQRVRLVTKH